jgi:hypothetical protein
MLIKVSPRWMVNTSQVRAIGHYKDNETDITVQFIDGDETNFDCGGRIVRDGILTDIEEIFCPKKALFDPKEEE